jgi:hypothetical protein
MFKSFIIATVSAVALCGNVANAEVSVFYRSGAWEALSGRSESGTQMCMVKVHSSDRSFMVKWFRGNPDLIIHIFKNGWNVSNQPLVDVSLQFDNQPAWPGKASGLDHEATGLEMRVSDSLVPEFLNKLRWSTSLRISFPTGSESDWTANMTGSNAAVLKMLECVNWTLNPRPTQPYTSQAQPPAVTQPYPTQPGRLNPTPVEAVHPVVKETI